MYSKPSEFLDDLDSHAIYNVAMLDECEFDTSAIPTSTIAKQRAAIEARGLGGFTKGDDADVTFTGWGAAEGLAESILGSHPNPLLQGRGSRFRACLEALRKAGH